MLCVRRGRDGLYAPAHTMQCQLRQTLFFLHLERFVHLARIVHTRQVHFKQNQQNPPVLNEFIIFVFANNGTKKCLRTNCAPSEEQAAANKALQLYCQFRRRIVHSRPDPSNPTSAMKNWSIFPVSSALSLQRIRMTVNTLEPIQTVVSFAIQLHMSVFDQRQRWQPICHRSMFSICVCAVHVLCVSAVPHSKAEKREEPTECSMLSRR